MNDRPPLLGPLVLPGRSALPVLLSVPHAGRDYPEWLLRGARRGKGSLEPLEDPWVDRLIWRAQGHGVPAVVAQTPRAAIDCNRAPHEIDPALTRTPPGHDGGARARAGLGLYPSRTIKHGELWRARMSAAEADRRLAEAYTPYHDAIDAAMEVLVRRHGAALLIDCHSMPPRGKRLPQVVIGDRFGTSAARFLSALAGRVARATGFTVAFNEPYAGGWITEHHGRPAAGRHALQIEIDRRCYLDDHMREPGPGFDHVARLIERLATDLGEALANSVLPLAAE